MSSNKQISVFQELFDQPRFSAVFQFYAGITKLKTYRWFLSILPKSFFPNSPRRVLDLIPNIISKQELSKRRLISLLHCLYEAEDPSLCQFVAEQLKGSLYLPQTTLSPLDCLSVGYFLSLVSPPSRGMFRANFDHCQIGDQGCKFLTRGLCKCLNTHSTVSTRLHLYMPANDIHEEGAQHIAELLTNPIDVQSLNLFSDRIGAEGLKSICEALVTNTSLTELSLSNCSIEISEDNGPALAEMLRRNNTLKVLDLSANSLTDTVCHYISSVLEENTSLRELNLCSCKLTDRGVLSLFTGLNDHLEELHLGSNQGLTISGLGAHASHLITPAQLRVIGISHHLIHVIFPVNQVRIRNGLPKIDVWGECHLCVSYVNDSMPSGLQIKQ